MSGPYPQMSPAAPGAAPAYPRKPYGGTPDGLLLAAAIVGFVFAGFGLLMVLMFALMYGFMSRNFGGFAPFDIGDFFVIMVIFALATCALTLTGAILVLRARNELKRTNGEQGKTQAIVGSVLMLPSNLIPGVLGLIGALMIEGPTPGAPPAAPQY